MASIDIRSYACSASTLAPEPPPYPQFPISSPFNLMYSFLATLSAMVLSKPCQQLQTKAKISSLLHLPNFIAETAFHFSLCDVLFSKQSLHWENYGFSGLSNCLPFPRTSAWAQCDHCDLEHAGSYFWSCSSFVLWLILPECRSPSCRVPKL